MILLRIGYSKPLGYLPINTIINICGVDLDELKTQLNNLGIKFRQYTEQEIPVFSGVVYGYHQKAMWPTDCSELVDRVAKVDVDDTDPLFIAPCFGMRQIQRGIERSGAQNDIKDEDSLSMLF